jgi:hypothetical protein
MLIDVSHDVASGRTTVKHTWKSPIDLFTTVRFAPTRRLETADAYALELLKIRYGTNLPTAPKALQIAQSCVASRLTHAFDAGGFEGLLLRDGHGAVAVCFGCTMDQKLCYSDFGKTSVFISLSPDDLEGFFRPASTFFCTRVPSAPATPAFVQSINAEMDKDAWKKLARDVFLKYEDFHTDRAKTPYKLDLTFSSPVVNFFIELLECLNEGLDDDESNVDFEFADEAIDLFIVRFGANQGNMTGALSAVRGIIKKFKESTCCPCCEWRQNAERVTELAERYCAAEVYRQDVQMAELRVRADVVGFNLIQEEKKEKKRREQKENAAQALNASPTDAPLPRTVEELRALVNTREKAMQKARAAANKLAANKTASKTERQVRGLRQGAGGPLNPGFGGLWPPLMNPRPL